MPEDTPTCQIHKKYNIVCANPPLPGDSDCLCILHSQNEAKDLAAFREALQAIFEQKALEYYDLSGIFFSSIFSIIDFLENREFEKFADFSEATFIGAAFFPGTTFKGGVDFSNATFKELAWFDDATFSELADFGGTSFTKMAFFFDATFKKEANFKGATFSGQAVFSNAAFTKFTDFTEATFMEAAEFSFAVVDSQVIFRCINPPKQGEQEYSFYGYFEDLKIAVGSVLRFQDLSLANVIFAGTDLRHMEFINIRWRRFRGRDIICEEYILNKKEIDYITAIIFDKLYLERKITRYDHQLLKIAMKIDDFWITEIIKKRSSYLSQKITPESLKKLYANKPSAEDYARIEELYRYLKINYEDNADFKKSGDFHYGEMEMHRKASPWRRGFLFSWYNLYKILSGYGERPIRAMVLLIFFLAVLTGLLSRIGLEILDPKHIPAFGDSFFYLLQKVTLQRPTWAEPVGFWGKLVAGFSVLFIPGQAALFLLALRNRLGRRR